MPGGDKSGTKERKPTRKHAKSRKRGQPVARVKFGSTVIPVYRSDAERRTRFTIGYYRDGRRQRRAFNKLDAAKREALLVAQQIQSGREHLTDLRTEDRDAYFAALRLLKNHDVPLVAAVQEYVRARDLLGDVPLGTAVEDYARRTRGIKVETKVAEVVEELLVARRQDGVSKRYMLQLQSNLRRFAGDFDVPIMQVQRDQIDDWLRGHDLATRTRNSLLATVKVLFSFAKNRSYLPANEPTEAEAVAKVKTGDVDTRIFTPDQFQKILHAAPPHLIPILTIGGFAGMRKAEMDRLDWNAVNLDRKIIEVRAGQAKTASRRVIPISGNLDQWLRPLERSGPVIPDIDYHRQVTALARKVVGEWPHNVLRHSYISYRIAEVKSAEQVALEAGNSPAIIFKHYRELATEEEADAWFGIVPKEGQWKNRMRWYRGKRKLILLNTEGKAGAE